MSIFPGAVATDSDLYIAVNMLSTQLTDNPLTIGATTVNVVDASLFPAVGFLSIDLEIIKYTGKTATSFTGCTRAADGTSASAHVQNSQVFHNVIAAHHNVLKDEIKAIETALGVNPSFLPLAGGSMTGNIAMGTNKITGLGNGTAAQDAVAFSQIYYGFQAPVQTIDDTSFTTSSSSFQATSTTASITPTSSSHRIKITVTGNLLVGSAADNGYITIYRDSTNLGNTSGFTSVDGVSTAQRIPVSMSYIDSPSTTSSVTYTVRVKNSGGAVNVSWGSSALRSVITLEEIV